MNIDTEFLDRCLETLEHCLQKLGQTDLDEIDYDSYRAACVKEFEIVLEQSGVLLRKVLGAYFADSGQADRLVFKDLFRHAAKRGLIDLNACERWLSYRDNRDDTAHNCGKGFAEATLELLPDFIADARALADTIKGVSDE